MVENGVMSADRPECPFLVWLYDFCLYCLYFLGIIDATNYIREPPADSPPDEQEPLAEDFEIAEVDNVDDSISELPEAGMNKQIYSFFLPEVLTHVLSLRIYPNIINFFIPG